MTRRGKIRLGLLFGGRSGEHEVSLTSAASVIEALDPEEFEISAIGITKTGKLASAAEVRKMLPEGLTARVSSRGSLEAAATGLRVSSTLPEERESNSCPEIIFPLLHGPYGEDGTIQGLLEIAGLPYIGCGVLASAVGLDKDVMKRLFVQAGLPTLPYRIVLSRSLDRQLPQVRQFIDEQSGYPVFTKPANLGSSVGVCKVHSESELPAAMSYSAQFDRKILVEKGIECRELECAILGNDEPEVSMVGEVVPLREFYDYAAKYGDGGSTHEIPARVEPELASEVRAMALRAFQAIDGSGLARVDFFLERGTNLIWLNEINTMPGFTPVSMYARLWNASGVAFGELIRRLVDLGVQRHRERVAQKVSADA